MRSLLFAVALIVGMAVSGCAPQAAVFGIAASGVAAKSANDVHEGKRELKPAAKDLVNKYGTDGMQEYLRTKEKEETEEVENEIW